MRRPHGPTLAFVNRADTLKFLGPIAFPREISPPLVRLTELPFMSALPVRTQSQSPTFTLPPLSPALGLPQSPPVAGESQVEPRPDQRRFYFIRAAPSWLVSAVVHFVALLVLAMVAIEPEPGSSIVQIEAAAGQSESPEDLQDEKFEIKTDEPRVSERSDAVQQLTSSILQTLSAPSVNVEPEPSSVAVELSDFGEQTAPRSDLASTLGSFAGGGIKARGAEEQGEMIARYGGTPASQQAVAAALEWFARHQEADGSWSFDHRLGPCQFRCPDEGWRDSCKTGATAMALLAYLGAGETHKKGNYKERVHSGLYFLMEQMQVRTENGLEIGDLGGTRDGIDNALMYAHGLSAIALCEAYAMTQDAALKTPAQLSLNFIAYSQDPVGGGWRYFPRQPGDTSVVGWQLMALKSGHMGYLNVDPRTIKGAAKFLNSVQAQGGATYGYKGPGRGQGTTAIGLLCRMYLGWKKDERALQRGVAYVNNIGPSIGPLGGNMYYNYYATQVMRHYCGDPESEDHAKWVKWNTAMRDWLVSTQVKEGHAKGSWFMLTDHGSDDGGRLYCTSLATMILEVYYRHMPLYGKQAAEAEFPL